MHIQTVWSDRIPPRDGLSNTIWSLAIKPDGSQVVTAVGDRVLIYNAHNGELVTSLKGHRDTVFCVTYSKNGKSFASGGADRQVIIWGEKGDGRLKYSHNDSIQCLVFNPVTKDLASGTGVDMGLWSPERKSVTKRKTPSRVCSMCWTSDGTTLALGLFNGIVSIRDKTGAERRTIERHGAIWTLSWNVIQSKQYSNHNLVIGCWDRTISVYRGAEFETPECIKEQRVEFDPLSISFFPSGEYFVVSGSDNKSSLWSREGVYLGIIGEQKGWVWASAVNPSNQQIIVGSNDGEVTSYQICFTTIHGLYRDRYAFRDLMTDVVIQHLLTQQKVRIRCQEYVKKIAVYKEQVAFQLRDKVLIYAVNPNDPFDMKYKNTEKIKRTFECTLLVLVSHHIILCQKQKLQLYSFSGTLEREWNVESFIRYIKVIGGAPRKESFIVGLKNGQVQQLYIDNPFPNTLMKQSIGIRCLDLNASRTKLAVIDEGQKLWIYDLETKEVKFSEPNTASVAWNTEMEDMIAYNGENSLSIKTGKFEPYKQPLQGFVVGFNASKIYYLHNTLMHTIDVPQSSSMYRYMRQKRFDAAYEIACLGVTEDDWRCLAMEAMKNLSFEISRKVLGRIRDIRSIDLLCRLQNHVQHKTKISPEDEQCILAQILAYQGRHQEAAQLFLEAGEVNIAVEMFTDLRKWEEAKHWAGKAEKLRSNKSSVCVEKSGNSSSALFLSGGNLAENLIIMQAASSEEDGDLRAAGEMYMKAGQYRRAANIFAKIGAIDALIHVVRQISSPQEENSGGLLPPAQRREVLQSAAGVFQLQNHYAFARESLMKLGDVKQLLSLNVQLHRWEEAFALVDRHPELSAELYLPRAEWLVKEDRFEEARESFKLAGRVDLSLQMLEKLIENTIVERRFRDAARYFWLYAVETVQGFDSTGETQEQAVQRFWYFRRLSEAYNAYSILPTDFSSVGSLSFSSSHSSPQSPEARYRMCLFLWNVLAAPQRPPLSGLVSPSENIESICEVGCIGNKAFTRGILKANVAFTLAKEALGLQDYEVARQASQALQRLWIDRTRRTEADCLALKIKCKAHSVGDDFIPKAQCPQCLQLILPIKNSIGAPLEEERCSNCNHPVLRSFLEYHILPLVNFSPQKSLQPKRTAQLIAATPGTGKRCNPSEQSEHPPKADILVLGDEPIQFSPGGDRIARKIQDAVGFIVPGELHIPIEFNDDDLKAMQPDNVYILDFRKISPLLPVQYFYCVSPDFSLSVCPDCLHFFKQDALEIELLHSKRCPICRSEAIDV